MKVLEKKIYRFGLAVLILVFVVGLTSFWLRPATRLELCWLIKGMDGTILGSYPDPDGSFIIHVVKPDCGQTTYWGKIYGCSTRLDLELNHQIVGKYEMLGECNVSIEWLENAGEFEITYQSGKKSVAFTGEAFGILP
jgi:hypothetical protein